MTREERIDDLETQATNAYDQCAWDAYDRILHELNLLLEEVPHV
jgi:hypothetical protein